MRQVVALSGVTTYTVALAPMSEWWTSCARTRWPPFARPARRPGEKRLVEIDAFYVPLVTAVRHLTPEIDYEQLIWLLLSSYRYMHT